MTKHEQILSHIESLSIGQKISVRKIAKDLNVSEGTAYRAIKDADKIGLVATIDRVGTVRIEKKSREEIEQLTYNEIVKIVEGEVLGGKNGLTKTLNKFAIGAMELNDVVKYLSSNTLLIVGNREDVQLSALKKGSAVLITGGFSTTQEIIKYANEHDLPVLSSQYDTYLVANLINKAMYNQKIRKEILLVEDIVKPVNDNSIIFDDMTLFDYKEKADMTGHSRFPVVDKSRHLVGIVTSKEIIKMHEDDKIVHFMTRNPLKAQLNTTVASCAHMMIWEGIELLPVIDVSKKLIGVITRKDVLTAMQLIGRQPQVGEKINDQVAKYMTITNDNIKVQVTPLLTSQYGTLSKGVFVALIEESIRYEIRKLKKLEVMIESLNIIYIKAVQIESEIEIHYDMLDVGRNFAKMEVTMTNESQNVAKALIICQLIN